MFSRPALSSINELFIIVSPFSRLGPVPISDTVITMRGTAGVSRAIGATAAGAHLLHRTKV